MNAFKNFLTQMFPVFSDVVEAIADAGGTAYLVGGAVRDLILGIGVKDIDIEVHGLSLEKLDGVLKKFAKPLHVGKQFGVIKTNFKTVNIDWSIPRRDSSGRKPEVEFVPDMSLKDAMQRRDLTMNAMAIDLGKLDGATSIEKIIEDPWDGLADIKKRKLRAVDDKKFLEDPLRFFRVMQFAARFEMAPCDGLDALCKTMELASLASERITEELVKLFTLSKHPSLGFRWLKKIGRLDEFFPEVAQLESVEQNPKCHPEGDAFEHTMQVLDVAGSLKIGNGITDVRSSQEKLWLTLSSLCHDVGKFSTVDEGLHTHGHEKEGVPVTKDLLNRFDFGEKLVKKVVCAVRNHMMPWALVFQNSGAKAYKRLAARIHPHLSMRQLGLVGLCDTSGRMPRDGQIPKDWDATCRLWTEKLKEFLKNAERANVVEAPEPPVVTGQHLLKFMKPGPAMGKALKKAYEIQIEEGIHDLDTLLSKIS
ncbi:CCA tRNA nucleotidyltransferase [bacterium]|nr:CCA tRNA nucleotidyltransferase [bacterium]